MCTTDTTAKRIWFILRTNQSFVLRDKVMKHEKKMSATIIFSWGPWSAKELTTIYKKISLMPKLLGKHIIDVQFTYITVK